MSILNSISLPVVALLIWFHTDAVEQYVRLFRLSRLFRINEFENDKLNDLTLEYPLWLVQKHPGFFTKMVSCPWCIGFWISFVTCVIYGTIYLFPTLYLASISIYFFVNNKLV